MGKNHEYLDKDGLTQFYQQLNSRYATKHDVAGNGLGLVKSSEDNNKVSVEKDGVMTVNALSTDKLAQGDKTLILNGGGAS